MNVSCFGNCLLFDTPFGSSVFGAFPGVFLHQPCTLLCHGALAVSLRHLGQWVGTRGHAELAFYLSTTGLRSLCLRRIGVVMTTPDNAGARQTQCIKDLDCTSNMFSSFIENSVDELLCSMQYHKGKGSFLWPKIHTGWRERNAKQAQVHPAEASEPRLSLRSRDSFPGRELGRLREMPPAGCRRTSQGWEPLMEDTAMQKVSENDKWNMSSGPWRLEGLHTGRGHHGKEVLDRRLRLPRGPWGSSEAWVKGRHLHPAGGKAVVMA